jgi:RNA polymerase sigma factor (sigma-70 family)
LESAGSAKIVLMVSRTHATLLDRLRDGADPLAWEEFFGRYWRLIFSFAQHYGCSDHTAEEIVQEAMLTVFNERDVFRYDPARGRFRDWLATVVRHLVAQHCRQPAQRVRPEGGTSGAMARIEGREPAPDAAWEAAFEVSLLAALLDVVRREVSPETFQAFELLVLDELSGAQIAALTGLSRNAVYQARKRVVHRLRELGARYGDEGRLDEAVRGALESLPDPREERTITQRMRKTMDSRQAL